MDKKLREIAQATMLGDLMHVVLDCAKALPKPWQQLSEHEQDTWLRSIDKQCKSAIAQCVTLVAGGNHIAMPATLDSVTFKGGVKASLTIDKHSQNRIDLADAAGKIVQLVIFDPAELTGEKGKPAATKDQKSLPLDDKKNTEAISDDELVKQATHFVRTTRKCTISAIQREFKIGYNRAARTLEKLEALKVVSPADAQGARAVLSEQPQEKKSK